MATEPTQDVVAPIAATQEPVAPVDATAAPAEVTEAKPERTFTQAELDDILKERLAKERKKREPLERELGWLKQIAMDRGQTQQPAQQPAQKPQENSQRPVIGQFAEYDQYLEALADWKADQKVAEFRKQAEQQTAQRSQAEQLQAIQRAYDERVEKARAKYQDYDDVAHGPVPINDAMALAIRASEDGPDIAYYLGNHVEEAQRIYRLPPLLAVAEIGRIGAKLASAPPPTKPVTRTPAPITPVGSGSSPQQTDDPLDTDDIETWARKRNAQIAKKQGLRLT